MRSGKQIQGYQVSERLRSIVAVSVSAVAVAVIVLGFSSAPASAPTAEDRIATLSGAIKCPFCSGESIANSQAGVAADYRALIAERVAAGATDEEIIADFAAKFGDSYILDTSTSVWSVALWVIPIAALLGGGGVLFAMKRKSATRQAAP